MEESANARFKRSFGHHLWGGMIAATVLHFALFALWPTMTASDLTAGTDAPEMIDLPPDVEIPEAPEQIARPAQPVISDTEIDDDVTIPSTRMEDYRPEDLPAPTSEDTATVGDRPVWVPHTVAPRLINQDEVERALHAAYPSPLRSAGIGGTVTVHVFVDEDGTVGNVEVHEGSGYGSLDRAALGVAATMRFTPALNRDKTVAVWIQQDITFVSREPPVV